MVFTFIWEGNRNKLKTAVVIPVTANRDVEVVLTSSEGPYSNSLRSVKMAMV